jgi:uroporphyrinogen decarboxylase
LEEREGVSVLKALLKVIAGESLYPPPIWMMRQAGRYLPEYRQTREKAGGFLELCLNSRLAAEVTLQPVRRFSLDAAIIFSDILIVPHALGVPLWFEEQGGPQVEPVKDRAGMTKIRSKLDDKVVGKVFEAVSHTRASLSSEIALIGFCGAPWTVATYLVAGSSTEGQAPARELVKADPILFGEIIERLVAASIEYLVGQLRAGAEVVQIFDTWAGVLSADEFERWCLAPTVEIVKGVRASVPDVRIILFSKGIKLDGLERLIQTSGADVASLDQAADRKRARTRLSPRCALQGNLDPDTLVAGGAALDQAVDEILEDFRGSPHIFNLGHGIKPETPIAHVERMIARVRGA